MKNETTAPHTHVVIERVKPGFHDEKSESVGLTPLPPQVDHLKLPGAPEEQSATQSDKEHIKVHLSHVSRG